jgi:hypothetical protein
MRAISVRAVRRRSRCCHGLSSIRSGPSPRAAAHCRSPHPVQHQRCLEKPERTHVGGVDSQLRDHNDRCLYARGNSVPRASTNSHIVRISTFIVATIIVATFGSEAAGQQMTCGGVVQQLQQYVARVNAFANAEYSQGILIRCQGNPMCANCQLLQQLNGWYMQQSNMVNAWYYQIAQQCMSTSPVDPLNGRRNQQPGAPPTIDDRSIRDLRVDDQDRTVRIRIPSNPLGYQ